MAELNIWAVWSTTLNTHVLSFTEPENINDPNIKVGSISIVSGIPARPVFDTASACIQNLLNCGIAAQYVIIKITLSI